MEKQQADQPREGEAKDEHKDPHHENVVEEVAEELESRFLAAAEVATATTSPEVNLADAVLAGLEGQPKEDSEAAPGGEDQQRAASATVEDEPDPQGEQPRKP